VWGRGFALDTSPMLAASLLGRAGCRTAAETRASLTGAEVIDAEYDRTPEQAARAMKAAQRSLLRAYRKYQVVIEVELGKTRHYPAFQFRDGKIIDALAEINRMFATTYADTDPTLLASAMLDWWPPSPRRRLRGRWPVGRQPAHTTERRAARARPRNGPSRAHRGECRHKHHKPDREGASRRQEPHVRRNDVRSCRVRSEVGERDG